jgi:hypothetical protein
VTPSRKRKLRRREIRGSMTPGDSERRRHHGTSASSSSCVHTHIHST